MIADLIVIYNRELEKLKAEVSGYKDPLKMWLTPVEISNSAGNLCLHLVGNLNHFIGAQLGDSGYIRQRSLEFSAKNVPVATLLQEIDATKQLIKKTLKTITPEQLENDFPILVFSDQQQVTIGFMLQHLLGHLTYHLGQINYHRRLLDH